MRVRTIRLGDDRYAHVFVVRKPGKRGGRTVMGEPHTRKAPRSSTMKPDEQPTYKIKPNTGRNVRANIKQKVTRRGR